MLTHVNEIISSDTGEPIWKANTGNGLNKQIWHDDSFRIIIFVGQRIQR